MRIEGKDGKKKSDKRYECLENTSKTQKIGFINSVWCFEIAFPLKLSEHLQSLQVSINILAMKLQVKFNISM